MASGQKWVITLVYNLSDFNSVVSVKILSLYLDIDRWKDGLEVERRVSTQEHSGKVLES